MRRAVPTLSLLVLVLAPGLASAVRAEEGADAIVRIEIPEEGLPLDTALQVFARTTGDEFLWDPKDRGVIDRTMPGPTVIEGRPAEALATLRALLVPFDLVLIPLGEEDARRWWVGDVRAGTRILRLRPRYVEVDDENVDALEAQDGLYVSTVLRVRHLEDLRALRAALHRMVTGANIGAVTEILDARAVHVTDFAPKVAAIYRLVRALDVPPAVSEVEAEASVFVLPLRHAEATALAQLLEPLLGANRPWPWERTPQAGPAAPEDASAPRILADARLNHLVVRATPADRSRIETLVEVLDRPSEEASVPQTVVAVLRISHIHPREVSNTLTSLVQRGKETWRAVGDGHLPVVVDTSRNVVIEATPAALERIRRIIEDLDQPPPPEDE